MIHSFNKQFTSNFYRPGPVFCVLDLITKSVFGFISSLSLFLKGCFIIEYPFFSPKE